MRLKHIFAVLATLVLAAAVVPSDAAAQRTYEVRCESHDNRYNTCRLDHAGYVTMERRLSSAGCRQGRDWDWDRREIWVDDGCRAVFRVERYSGHWDDYDYDYDRDYYDDDDDDGDAGAAAAAAGIVLGAAILGALINNDDHEDEHKYKDDSYQGARHTSYVPSWMVGTFEGYNPAHGSHIEMTIQADGRMQAVVDGKTISGYVNDERLHAGQFVYDIDQTNDGFVTHQEGELHNEVRYRRVR